MQLEAGILLLHYHPKQRRTLPFHRDPTDVCHNNAPLVLLRTVAHGRVYRFQSELA